jgi:hypothetical protein
MKRTYAAVLVAVSLSGCNYSFRAGSFPPPEVKTIAIEPFDNKTDQFEVGGELYDQMLKSLPSALGLRTAGTDVANAVVKGTITNYQVAAPNYQSAGSGQAANVIQRQVTITVDVEIVDLVTNVVLWKGSSVSAQGQFLEAGESEQNGRQRAIDLLVKKIVDGAQSNW